MNHLQLTRDTLDVGKISDIASAESCGAISLFVGTTRDSFEEKKVLSLEYEAYEPMALKQLELICRELRRQWPDIRNIAICHRLGLVKIREASVVIAISSPHRGTSLNAVSFAIDELKRHVPIWKKEMYEEEAIWKENKECQWLKQMSDNPGGGTASKLNLFNKCMYYMEDPLLLSSQFVQISACEDEIKRRIQCFVEKKRDEINICNVMDFTGVKRKEKYNKNEASITQEGKDKYNDDTRTCARVNSIVVKQECSKCHLKVRRVENNIGPQTRPDYLNTLDKLMVPVNRESLESCFIGNQNEGNHARFNSAESNILKHPQILERLENLEKYLFIPQSKNDILQRLRVIEDRLLYLESISPEYIHFLDEQSQERSGANERVKDIKPTGIYTLERNLYSVSEIDTIIQSFEKRNRNHVV